MEVYAPGNDLPLAAIGLTVPIAALYRDIRLLCYAALDMFPGGVSPLGVR